MSDLNRLRVVVAGAGAVGSVVALVLARQGAQVRLADPAPLADNASGVAAGMLAPVFETLLDAASTDHYLLLMQARDAWPALIHGLPAAPLLDRSGAMAWIPDEPEALAARIAALGAQQRLLDAQEARALAPSLELSAPWAEGGFVFTPDDWRLDPRIALAALQGAFKALGGQPVAASAIGFKDGVVHFDRATPWAADLVVLATGARTGCWRDAGGDAHLMPIKGQILRFAGLGPRHGPVVRGEGGYVVPDAGGVVVGATMEVGLDDLDVDADAVAHLQRAAAGLFPHLAGASPIASVGVRAATADGLPLVGPSLQPGVLLARGARRNGWLLAPTIAAVILDHVLGRPPSAEGRLFDPARFT